MRCHFASGFDDDTNHVSPRQRGAIVVEADGFVGVGDVVVEGVGGKAAVDISKFALRSREVSWLVVLMNKLQLTLEQEFVSNRMEPSG